MADLYEDLAEQAGLEFLVRLRATMEAGSIKQQDLAAATGYSESTISEILKHGKVTEKFIRAVAMNVSGMRSEYMAYRRIVDAPFLPDASEDALAAMSSEQRLELMEHAWREMGNALNVMKEVMRDEHQGPAQKG